MLTLMTFKKFFSFVCLLLSFSFLHAQQLVLPGDYPDPSVIKIGDTYWASATTSNWAPAYPILKSKDLRKWETVSYVFPELPGWADYYFWAPELSYDNGKVYVYYAAHKKGGNLCVGIASADKPEGPYKDHGPIICQEVGSIDAFPMRDENGKLHLIWKEDANSVRKPTPIWIAELNEERTKLIGEPKEIFRNDKEWEANLVEGFSLVRNGEYFYAFYAAAGCCGAACTYGIGVARAKSLHGPWEKYEKNPVMTSNGKWKCPGHGTPVDKQGKHYFMYHAYEANSTIFTGREGLISEYRFTDDGWIEFINKNDSDITVTPIRTEDDTFDSAALGAQWQWSVFYKPQFSLQNGRLSVTASDSAGGAMLGHKILSASYSAVVEINRSLSTAKAGLAVIGDEKNRLMAVVEGNTIRVIQRKNGSDSLINKAAFGKTDKIFLKAESTQGREVRFFYSTNGLQYSLLTKSAISAAYLPPWDRAVRVGVIAPGKTGKAFFDRFSIKYP